MNASEASKTGTASTEKTAGERDPATLEREADEIRADMDRTLDALERRFSPAQLLDRSMTYLRDHGADLTHAVGDTVKSNPVPILMTVAGLTWLLTSTIMSRRQGAQDSEHSEYMQTGPAGESRLRSKVSDRVAATRERIRESREAPANKVSGAVGATREQTERLQTRLRSLIEEQPLALGAISLAVGAIIGAAVPGSTYEKRTVGRVRDRALSKAREVGERQYNNLRQKLDTPQGPEGTGRAH